MALSAFIYKCLKHQNKSLPSTLPSEKVSERSLRLEFHLPIYVAAMDYLHFY